MGQFPVSFWKAPLRLPAVDIFKDLSPPLVSGLSDLNFDCSNPFLTSTRTSPVIGKTVTFQPGFLFTPANSNSWAIWVWADVVNFGGSLDVTGAAGNDAGGNFCTCTPYGNGGDGGYGASGGGGGGISAISGAGGGNGGSGDNGTTGQSDLFGCGCGNYAGNGGVGSAAAYMSGCPYVVPSGGQGGSTGGCGYGAGGAGGPGYGGGGAGGGASGGFPLFVAGGGGGGGAGFIGVVANQIIGAGALYAMGSNGGNGVGCGGQQGSRGGGGSIYMAAKTYAGTMSFSASAAGGCCGCSGAGDGNYQLAEINRFGNAISAYHNNTNTSWIHS